MYVLSLYNLFVQVVLSLFDHWLGQQIIEPLLNCLFLEIHNCRIEHCIEVVDLMYQIDEAEQII